MPRTPESHPDLFDVCKKFAPRLYKRFKSIFDESIRNIPKSLPKTASAEDIKESQRKYRQQLENDFPIFLMNHPKLPEFLEGTKYEKYLAESKALKPK